MIAGHRSCIAGHVKCGGEVLSGRVFNAAYTAWRVVILGQRAQAHSEFGNTHRRIGAFGGTGQAVVHASLFEGFEVAAFVRTVFCELREI